METINSEEQRNYIEILRGTIESSIIKQGLKPILQEQKNTHYHNNLNNIDVVIDISKLKTETEKYRKELILSQALIIELKQEIEFLNKINDDANIKNERFENFIENGMHELEETKEKSILLQKEKDELIKNYEISIGQLECLKEELNNSNSLIGKYEKEIYENTKKLNELGTQVENSQIIQNKMSEYKISLEKIYEDFEKNIKENKNLKIDVLDLKEEIEGKEIELNNLKNSIDEKEIIFENEKKKFLTETENLKRLNKKIERSYNDSDNNLKEKEKEFIKLEGKLIEIEKNLREITDKYDDLEDEFDQFKKLSEKKIDSNEKNIYELSNTTNTQKILIENLNLEKSNLVNEQENLKNLNYSISCDYLNLEKELKNKNLELEKFNNELQNIKVSYKNCEEEKENLEKERNMLRIDNVNLKHTVDTDNVMKNNEINILKEEINNLNLELLDKRNNILDLNE